ncbi:MAG TPA: ABC transporter permease [Candidatus Nitrosocosmicus sp.]|nr:ABC transporter permease [Candidatus Nitrosocosmicus sp.]
MNENINLHTLKKTILYYGFYIVFAVMLIVYAFGAKNFLSADNLLQVLMDSSASMVICAGLTFVVLTGALDLSVGSVAFVSATVSAILIKNDFPIWLALLAAVLTGMLLGAVNGVLITKLKMNPMLTTLGMMIGLRGLALQLTNGMQIYIPKALKQFGMQFITVFPLIVLFGLIMLVLAQFVLSRTKFGRYVIAIGCGEKSAEKVGINVTLNKFLIFVISGVCASLGGIVSVINMGAVQPYLGKGMEFTTVAAIVLGGTSLFGGKGSFIPGTLMGVLMLSLIENGLGLMGASPFIYPFVRGLIIFVAMYADSLKDS